MLAAARRRAGRARLALGLLCLTVAGVALGVYCWYQTAPVAPGFYPSKVLGGAYPAGPAKNELRYPVMWVRSRPFQSLPSKLGSVSLLDEEGNVVASADAARFVPAEGQATWKRFVWGWVVLQARPGREGRIAYTACVGTGSAARSYDVGALAVLATPEGNTGDVLVNVVPYLGSTQGLSEPGAPGLWLVLSVSNAMTVPVEVGSLAPAGLSWLFTPGQTVLRSPEEGMLTLPGAGDTRVIIIPATASNPLTDVTLQRGTVTIIGEPQRQGTAAQLPLTASPIQIRDWAPPDLWIVVEGPATIDTHRDARFALGLAPYAEQLRDAYFLYLSAEMDLAQEGRRWARGVTFLDDRPRSWRAFQTVQARTY